MKKTIKKFPGALPLGKDVQKNIKGGVAPIIGGKCRITYSNGSATTIGLYDFHGSCAQQSAAANSVCINVLTNANVGGDSCGYDCGCDGWGQ